MKLARAMGSISEQIVVEHASLVIVKYEYFA